MRFGRNKFALGALVAGELVFLSACGAGFDYQALRRTQITGQQFGAALGRAYRELALYEADQMYDWPDAARYGAKSLDAAKGKRIPPDRLGQRRLPTSARPILAAARGVFETALQAVATARWPQLAAEAQSSFDCWVEQQEERIQADHIAVCRNKFQDAMARLSSTVRRDTTLYFEYGSDRLAAGAGANLDQIAPAYWAEASITIEIAGHADRAGSVSYNRTLSRGRAEAVRGALIGRGVPIKVIALRAFGEERPRVATRDGIHEPRNRRVEIRFSELKNL